MPVTTDIARSYVRPRAVMRRLLAAGQREDRAIAILMAGCLLVFVAQWPRLAREAQLDGAPLDQALAYSFFGWLMLAPLIFYGLAALSHVVARLFGGQGSWYGARLALFWALLAASPLMLLNGLVAGLIGPGPALSLVGGLWVAGFVLIWLLGLVESELPPPEAQA